MNTEHLLRAVRPVYALVRRPGEASSVEPKFWSMRLDGLHQNAIKASADALRSYRKSRGRNLSNDETLKLSGLHHGLAKALGAKTFDAWRQGEEALAAFLVANDMTEPANLISWSRAPSQLTARQISDRLFNSGLPMPEKIFTGVGSQLLMARDVGRFDLYPLNRDLVSNDNAALEWCEAHAQQIVLSSGDGIALNGRDLLLHALRFEYIYPALNLLGDNLVTPPQRPPEFRLYNLSQEDIEMEKRVFSIFREEIEHTESGWVNVIRYPGNANIVFLKGQNGAFDWVIRDQREEPFSGNTYFPILMSHELPTAMKRSELNALIYFRTGEWYERLEHDAETRHYEDGGTVSTWPGYSKLLLRELIASRPNFVPPRQPKGFGAENFVPHRLNGYCLMVSPPVAIKDFWRFFENSDWRDERLTRSERTSTQLEADLAAVNLHDEDHLPASVTWFDAVAFCRHYEKQTGLPVRLLEVEEWKEISPPPAQDIEKDGWGDLTWVVVGEHGETRGETEQFRKYPDVWSDGGCLRFGKELTWSQNVQGLPFVSVVDFGEWLADCANGYAPVGNAATGKALMTGPIDRDRCPTHLTMRYKGLKVGFRLCYVAQPDA